jgi:UDP-glucuronate decarboxylase
LADPRKHGPDFQPGPLQLPASGGVERGTTFPCAHIRICGDPEVHPQIENYQDNVNTVGPRSCYDEGQRFAETLVTDVAVRRGLVMRMARIFNTYGPACNPTTVAWCRT